MAVVAVSVYVANSAISVNGQGRTLSSAQASSGPSPVTELSLLFPPPFILLFSKSGGGELALELDMFDGGRRGVTRGDVVGDDPYLISSPPRELVLLPDLWCVVAERSSSTALKDGVNPFVAPLEAPAGMNASCSAFVALRICTVFPISVTVAET